MNCQACGYTANTNEAHFCSNCGRPLREPGQPSTVMYVNQSAGHIAGQMTAVELDSVSGGLQIVIQNQTGSPRSVRFHVPPVVRGKMFGRSRELAEVIAALHTHQTIRLSGMAGIGKTFLAAKAAEYLQEQKIFPRGILWLGELGAAPVAALCDAIAHRLGDEELAKLPAQAKPDAVRDLLAAQTGLMLVLDQIAGSDTVSEFLARCLPSKMPLLVTSRGRHFGFEWERSLSPLEPAEANDLFRDRAMQILDKEIVGDICELLENHPLAIVIAASRVRDGGLPLTRLLARLTEEKSRLSTLQMDNDSNPAGSVRASLQLSYADLEPDEKRVFTRLAACFGKATGLELLAGICRLSEFDCENLTGKLIFLSLAERRGDLFGLAGLVQDFGRRELGAELGSVQDQVLEAVKDYVERYSKPKPENYDRLEAELGNVIGAIRYAMDRQSWTTALTIAGTIGAPISGVLAIRGYWAELETVALFGLRATEAIDDEQQRIRWILRRAITLHRRGDYDMARQLYLESVAASKQEDYKSTLAIGLHELGMLAQDQGKFDEASGFYMQSMDIKKIIGDQAGLARSQNELGRIAHRQGKYSEAQQWYQQSLELKKDADDQHGIAITLYNFGRLAREQGRLEEAREYFRQSQSIYNELTDRYGIAINDHNLGRIAHDQGAYEEAHKLYQQSLEVFKSLKAQDSLAQCLLDVGRLAADRQELETAQSLIQQSLELMQQLKDPEGIAEAIHNKGELARYAGDYAQARQLFEQSLVLRRKLGSHMGVAASLNALGRVFILQEKYDDALPLLTEGLQISQKLGLQPLVAHNLFDLAVIARHQGRLDDAKSLGQQSLETFQRLNSPRAQTAQQHLADLETS